MRRFVPAPLYTRGVGTLLPAMAQAFHVAFSVMEIVGAEVYIYFRASALPNLLLLTNGLLRSYFGSVRGTTKFTKVNSHRRLVRGLSERIDLTRHKEARTPLVSRIRHPVFGVEIRSLTEPLCNGEPKLGGRLLKLQMTQNNRVANAHDAHE
jgi:hypothetical protein